jgi:TPP-dependent pyruvate/acetoin dehydrogenase alpha subunit
MYEPLYKALYRIRRVEEEIARVYPSDQIKSPVHLSIGQESVSVGICAALQPADVVFGTYRGHALYLAKGGDLRQMIAELYGKVTGCTRGKGGSMHLIAPEAGVMGTSAVVGTTIANAVGFAYALRYRRTEAVVASFFGDGATEEGVFAESLNFAVLKRLPILFICENNRYAIHTHQNRRQGKPAICERARAFGMPAERLDGNDFLPLCERAREVVARVRGGEGPWFFEVFTYRWQEHVGPGRDYHLGYRTEEEAAPWIASDPVRRLGERIAPEARTELEEEVEAEIAEAFAFAEASPFPDAAELYTDVFKENQDGPDAFALTSSLQQRERGKIFSPLPWGERGRG